jgi:predicted phosphodiesterase
MAKTIKRIKAEEVCRQFPDTPTMTLAKKLYKENVELYKDVEEARLCVRIVRGKAGDYQRKHSVDKSLYKKEDGKLNPFELPPSHAEHKRPFKLPKACKKILLLSDIHIPYQDNEAIEAACNYGLEQGCDTVFLNGDILDFYGLSFHEKDPRNRPTIADELEMGRKFFKWLRNKFKKQTIYFITGNHEARLERYLRVKAPELLNISEFKLPFLLNLAEVRVIPIEHRAKVYAGKLMIEHGDKMFGAGGVNPARSLLLRFKRSVICGHFHRTTQANSKVYDGDTHMAWSTGCLCELEPSYMEVNEHNHGFATIEVFDNGNYKVINKQIFNGKVY